MCWQRAQRAPRPRRTCGIAAAGGARGHRAPAPQPRRPGRLVSPSPFLAPPGKKVPRVGGPRGRAGLATVAVALPLAASFSMERSPSKPKAAESRSVEETVSFYVEEHDSGYITRLASRDEGLNFTGGCTRRTRGASRWKALELNAQPPGFQKVVRKTGG